MLRHEIIKMLFTHHTPSLFLHVLMLSSCRISFFCLSGFSFMNVIMIHRTAEGKGGGAISLYPFYHFDALYRHSDISQLIAAGSSPLRIAGTWTRAETFWFPSISREALSYTPLKIRRFCTYNSS